MMKIIMNIMYKIRYLKRVRGKHEKIMIFGTGNYYERIKAEINLQEIIAFVDNNSEKVGKN